LLCVATDKDSVFSVLAQLLQAIKYNNR